MRGGEPAAGDGGVGASLCSTKSDEEEEGVEVEGKGEGKVVSATRRRSESAEPMARGSSQRRSTAAWRECARGFIAGGGCGGGPQVAVARFCFAI